MTLQDIYQLLSTINEKYNQILLNAKTIPELEEQLELVDTSFVHVSNNGTSEKLQIKKIIDAIVTGSLNQLLFVGEITIDGTELTVPAGVQWKIQGINYFTATDFVQDIELCETGKIRKDIIVGNTSNQLVYYAGVENEGVAIRPNIPLNTVLVTEINVTDTGFDYVVSNDYIQKAEYFQKLITGSGEVSVVLDTQETNFRIVSDDITMIEGTSPTSGYLSQYLREDKLLSFINKTANPIVFKHSVEIHNFRLPNGVNLTVQPNEIIRFRQAKDDVSICYEFDSLSRVGSSSGQNLEQTLELGDRGYREDLGTGLTILLISDRTKVVDSIYGDDLILPVKMFRLTDELIIKNSYGMPIKIYGTTDIDTGNFPSINGNAIDETTYIEIPAASKAILKKYFDEDFIGEFWMMTLQFETVPSSGPTSTDFLPEGATNKYFTDARALAAVPTASPSTQGKTKLYSNLTSTNTDGAVRQKEVVERFNEIGSTLESHILLLINNNLRQSTDRTLVYLFDHFIGTGLANGYASNNANGGNTSVGENKTGAKGVSITHTGTSTATGQGALVIGNTNFPPIIIGQGNFYFRARVQVPILSDSSQSFYAQEGFLCNGNRYNPSGSMMFMYDEAGTFAAGANAGSPNWKCVTTNGTSRTFSVTSIPVIAGTWYELLIIVNAAGTQVDFYIDGNLQFSHTTNIPTIPCFINHSIVKTVGNTQRETVRDWFQFQHN